MSAGCTGCHPICFWVRALEAGESSDTKGASQPKWCSVSYREMAVTGRLR
jgi:hypothetical protein